MYADVLEHLPARSSALTRAATPEPGQDGSSVDKARIERAVREILYAIGEDPAREGLSTRRSAWPRPTPTSSPVFTTARAGI